MPPARPLHPFVLRLFALTALSNLHHFVIDARFLFNDLWLAVFAYASPLFLMGMLFLIYAILMYVHFFRDTSRA
jgi:hypothetical protein